VNYQKKASSSRGAGEALTMLFHASFKNNAMVVDDLFVTERIARNA